jgi:hypothetical protein
LEKLQTTFMTDHHSEPINTFQRFTSLHLTLVWTKPRHSHSHRQTKKLCTYICSKSETNDLCTFTIENFFR